MWLVQRRYPAMNFQRVAQSDPCPASTGTPRLAGLKLRRWTGEVFLPLIAGYALPARANVPVLTKLITKQNRPQALIR